MQPGYWVFKRLRYFRVRENVRLAAHLSLQRPSFHVVLSFSVGNINLIRDDVEVGSYQIMRQTLEFSPTGLDTIGAIKLNVGRTGIVSGAWGVD
jgi:hypothetical protein